MVRLIAAIALAQVFLAPAQAKAEEALAAESAWDSWLAPLMHMNCEGSSTRELNRCAAAILERADEKRLAYLDAAIDRISEQTELAQAIREADGAFTAYRDSECEAIYLLNIQGSIRNLEYLACAIILTDLRTHTIWRHWLTYPDRTPPILPEPAPRR